MTNTPVAGNLVSASPAVSQPPDAWETPQKILVILAHPDDPEFFCGATIARWSAAGHAVRYCLLTCGDKGSKDISASSEQVCNSREDEQRRAAAVLGVHEVRFLNYPDGYLVPDIDLRLQVTRVLRQERPDVVVTCDPNTLFTVDDRLNHPDHRAAGQAVLDAVYPSARDHLYFPELFLNEKLEPHIVREVWVAGTLNPNVILDVTPFWRTKLKALYEHRSQIGDPEQFSVRMNSRRTADSTPENPRFEERFRRVILG
jgi:LmbE family N-acetylglucosaminyl deacetylase